MKKLAFISILALAACDDPTPEQRTKLKQALPDGCEVIEVGQYGSIDQLIIIDCNGRDVTASYSYMSQSNGKTTEIDRAAVYVIR